MWRKIHFNKFYPLFYELKIGLIVQDANFCQASVRITSVLPNSNYRLHGKN